MDNLNTLIRNDSSIEKKRRHFAGLKFKILASNLIVPFMMIILVQFVSQIFNPYTFAFTNLKGRIHDALNQPLIFLILLFGEIISYVIIMNILKPVLNYLNFNGEKGDNQQEYEKARKTTVKIPWILVAIHAGLWFVGNTVFYIIYNWKAPKGLPFSWSLALNMLAGLNGAIIVQQIISFVFLPYKKMLNMNHIHSGEKDFFNLHRQFIVILLIIMNFIVYFGYFARFYYTLGTDIPVDIPFSTGFFLLSVCIALVSFVLYFLNQATEKFQLKTIKNKLQTLGQGKANLSERVVLLNFDEFGGITDSFNDVLDQFESIIKNTKKSFTGMKKFTKNMDEVMGQNSVYYEKFDNTIQKLMEDIQAEKEIIEKSQNSISQSNSKLSVHKKNIEAANLFIKKSGNNIQGVVSQLFAILSDIDSLHNFSEEMKKDIGSSFDTIKNYLTEMGSFQVYSEKIANGVNRILEIGSQINVLAINASIESAHAGQFGKGFAVIAQSISLLSSQTSAIIEEIKLAVDQLKSVNLSGMSKTEDIKKSMNIMLNSIQTNDEKVGELVKTLGNQKNNLDSIVDNLSEIEKRNKELESIFFNQIKEMEYLLSIFRSFESFDGNLDKEINAIAGEFQTLNSQNISLSNEYGSLLKVTDQIEQDLKGYT